MYATKFKTKAHSARVRAVLSDVDSFLDMDNSRTDISDLLVALHAKTDSHDTMLTDMRKQALELSRAMKSYL